MLTFTFSAELFWGFTIVLDMYKMQLYPTIDHVIDYAKNELKVFLRKRNLQVLAESVDKMNLHCHEYASDALLTEILDDQLRRSTTHQQIVYLCDHGCHGGQDGEPTR